MTALLLEDLFLGAISVGAVLAYTLIIYARGYSDGSRDTAELCDCKEGP